MTKIVVIGGSAGSINALKAILQGLPENFPAAVLAVTHIGSRESILPSLLEHCSALPVRHAVQGEPIVPGHVLIAPSDLHLTVAESGGRAYAQLSRGPKENHARPAIDPLFRSAAAACRADAIAVVLSGFLDDGTVGLQAIKASGGIAIAQDPDSAEAPDMPASAIEHATVDFVRRVEEIAPTLVELVGRHTAGRDAAAAAHARTELQDWINVENRMFEEDTNMEELDRIGSRVPLTCPECGGAIWELRQAGPLRYRCHTGHAFTAKVLAALQGSEIEEAMWAAVRALHEQAQLFRQLDRNSRDNRHGVPGRSNLRSEYLLKAEQAADQAQLLRDLIAARVGTTPH
jgi:two-component system chemotaxis response regulator CheB